MHDETRTYKPDQDATRTHSPDLGDSTRAQSDEDAKRSGQMSAQPNVPGYQLLEEVGQGGMGIVYRARDLSLNRDVAVKLLLDRIATDGPTAKRFLEEAQITGQLQHPGIPAVHQVGTLPSGRPYLAMKLIKGRSLSDMLAEKEPINVLAIFEQIAQAVGYAHAHNVIHRDLKPANVMVGAFGEVQVMDWGLAKVLASGGNQPAAPSADSSPHVTQIHSDRDSDSDQLSKAGSAIGTAAFMPPEQAIGAHERMGPPSDVFGLGAVLCTLLTGEAPYSGESWEATRQQAAMAVQTLMLARLAACGAEPELAALCRHCLAPDPKARPVNGAAVAEAVARLRSAADERAKQAEVDRAKAEVQVAEQRKRRRVQMAFGSAVLAALLIGSAVAGWQAWEANQSAAAERNATQVAEAAAKTAIEQKQRADDETEKTRLANLALQKQSQEQRRLLDVLRMKVAGRSFDNNLVEYARELLGEVAAENRTSAWHLLKRHYEGSELTHYEQTHAVTGISWSPDGRTLATATGEGTVRLRDALTWQTLKELPGHINPVLCVAWSPDGHTLASGSDEGCIRLWDAASGQNIKEFKAPADNVHTLAFNVSWSPDGRMLASAGHDAIVRVWDISTSQCVKQFKSPLGSTAAIAWSPDSRTLAVPVLTVVWLWDVANHERIGELEGHTGPVMSIAWNPDGRSLATSGMDNTVRIWDAATRECLKELKGHTSMVMIAAWSPDGRTLASSGFDGTVRIWSAGGESLKELKGHTNIVSSICWSPDSRLLASGSIDRTMRIWDATTEPNNRRMTYQKGAFSNIAWNPDGRTLAVGMLNNSVNIFDAKTGHAIKELPVDAPISSVSWSPDGQILALAAKNFQNNTVLLRDAGGKNIGELKGLTGHVTYTAWSPDSRTLATASGDNAIRLWDRSGQILKELKGHSSIVQSIAWSPDGHTLASASWDNTVRLWDASGQFLKELTHPSLVTSVCWSPDGRTLATGCWDKQVRLWDAVTLQCTRVFTGHIGYVSCVAWSLDGRTLASGGSDHAVRLWDTATGQSLAEFKGHTSNLLGVAWSPDGRTLASVSAEENTVRLWDAEKGPVVQELIGHNLDVSELARSRDGKQIVSIARLTDLTDPKNKKETVEKIVWDAATGERLKDAPISELADPSRPADDGFDYIRMGRKILKLTNVVLPEEIVRREWLLAPRPEWHREQAAECRNQSNWFAAAYHLRRLLALEPQDVAVKTRLAATEKRLQIREEAPMPKRASQ